MKMRRIRNLILPVIILSFLLSACGVKMDSGSGVSMNQMAAANPAYAEKMEMSAEYITDDIYLAETGAVAEEDTGAAQVSDISARKLIREANLSVETEAFDDLMAVVESKVAGLGGYMENYNTGKNGYSGNGGLNRYASLTVRIPAVNYDQFITAVAQISNVLSRNESVKDVTLQYVDLESHKKVLLVEQERLLEFLGRAETIEDIITLESRLSEVRYQIESMESQLRVYDNLVDYSTIYLQINEVQKLTPVEEQTTWEKISTGFGNSVEEIGTGFKNLFIWLLVVSPYLVLIAVLVVLTIAIVKFCKGRDHKKRAIIKTQLENVENKMQQEEIKIQQEKESQVKKLKENKN